MLAQFSHLMTVLPELFAGFVAFTVAAVWAIGKL